MDMTPALAFNRGNYSDAPILFNLSERKAVPSDMDELRGNTTWATPHGWFLVRRPACYPGQHNTSFLWNPSSNGDKIQLPPLQEDVPADCTCLLSDDKPTAGGCVVLLLHAGGAGGWGRHEYDIGTQILYPDETLHEKLVIAPVASCRGSFYFTTATGFQELGVIEFRATTPPAFSSHGHARRRRAGLRRHAHSALVFMVESKGRPHMVNLLFDGSFSSVVYEVSVYRMDMDFTSKCPGVRPRGPGVPPSAGWRRTVSTTWDRGLMVYSIKEGTMKVETIEEAPQSLWMLPADHPA